MIARNEPCPALGDTLSLRAWKKPCSGPGNILVLDSLFFRQLPRLRPCDAVCCNGFSCNSYSKDTLLVYDSLLSRPSQKFVCIDLDLVLGADSDNQRCTGGCIHNH
jgi:hypothetical protein